MAGPFEAISGGGAAIGLDEVEMSILRSLVVQLLELVGPGQAPVEGEDPLAELFAEGPSEPPADPALARLFPDAYGEKEPDFSSEFRRFTENDLRARKREDALAVVRALDEAGAPADDAAVGRGESVVVLKLSAEDSRHWLGALNDLRLTIGTRLEVTDEDEDGQLYRLPDDDPRKPMVMAYLWLGALQESLVETLMP
ncbi:DUF2017 domain-containing protein [Streptomyces sp. NBC_01500]|uniref:DUF2017 domain-containing protein n=1 Tax=Streptomyces sp. NBC_01500 TaxID=2903886 RepID=UPI00224FB657|nr:DUF2017 domain-containing protein [Streptomyces sp. NBC_01500]MCX4550838.1 DUF2017 domain-containing protein [Streptomyces sp. NBC_01500]